MPAKRNPFDDLADDPVNPFDNYANEDDSEETVRTTPARTYPGPSEDFSTWVKKTGETVRLVDMDDLHLARAMTSCMQYDGLRHGRTLAILDELARRARG